MSMIYEENIKPHCLYCKANFAIWKSLKSTQFDKTILSSWKSAENAGALNYKISECEMVTKIVNVKECNFIVTLNEKRFSNRRAPQEMISLFQAFDHSKFNFTKIRDSEILMTHGLRKEEQEVGYPINQNVIIVNASPFQEGHSLLVPELNSCHNQVMRKRPLRTALDTLLISGEEKFTIAFNSLMACASVNHLHFHLWLNDEPLVCSTLGLDCLIDLDYYGKIYHMPQHPVHNVVVLFKDLESIDFEFEKLWNIVYSFQILHLAHSICFMRSSDGIRAIVWPRNIESDYSLKLSANQTNRVFNVAVAEMAGQIFTGDKDFFENEFDSDLLERSFQRINLSDDRFNELILSLKNYFYFK